MRRAKDAVDARLKVFILKVVFTAEVSTRIAFFTAPIWGTDLKGIHIACEIGSQPTCGIGILSNSNVEFQGARASSCRTLSSASCTTITPCARFQRLRTRRKTDRFFPLKGLNTKRA